MNQPIIANDGDVVEVKWWDAYHVQSLKNSEIDVPGSGAPMISIGYLAAQSLKKIAIAMTKDCDDWEDALVIPIENIHAMEVVKRADQ